MCMCSYNHYLYVDETGIHVQHNTRHKLKFNNDKFGA